MGKGIYLWHVVKMVREETNDGKRACGAWIGTAEMTERRRTNARRDRAACI